MRAIDLPGPDQNQYLPKIIRAVGMKSALSLLNKVEFRMPPHLFTMVLCLGVSPYLSRTRKRQNEAGARSAKRVKKASSIKVSGKHVLYDGEIYQHRRQFLLCTVRSLNEGAAITNPNQPIAKAIYDEKRYKGKHIVILEDVPSNNYKAMLTADWLGGNLDLKKMANVRKQLVSGRINHGHTVLHAVDDMAAIVRALRAR